MGKKLLGLALALVLVLSLVPAAARAAETVASGTCGANGDNLTWNLDSDGLLTISGTGNMADYTAYDDVPWASNRQAIKRLTIGRH